MTLTDQGRRTLLLSVLLAAVTLAVFSPVLRHDFIRYDDRVYVTDNPRVLSGLTAGNVVWAFTSGYASNWHPVTWISHMLDVELFGLRPAGHHLTSLLLHAGNGVLLFLVLQLMTGARWPSWVAAALFALHPLRVESVAWVAERKDVLSAAFLLLTLWCYTRHAQSSGGRLFTRHYGLALGLFALGLMSKPMLVTVPFLLLLLDYWPLGRVSCEAEGRNWARLRPLVIEKLPFLGLALGSSLVTLAVQQQAQALSMALPIGARLANAVVVYWKYLGKFVWPAELSVFYPHPDTNYPHSEQWPTWAVGLAALLLGGVTVAVLARVRKAPWGTSGWLWYLGTLVPVIGLVQVGRQEMADRYTYIPLIGIAIALVWSAAAALRDRPALARLAGVGTAVWLAALGLASAVELRHWRDNLTLFQRALAVNPNNAVAHTMVGIELGERGDYENAIRHFESAIRAAPGDAEPHFGLGTTYQLSQQPDRALEHYRMAVKLNPAEPSYHNRLGEVLREAGTGEEALANFQRAVELNPEFWQARVNLGLGLAAGGDLQRAEAQFAAAARLAPFSTEPLLRLAENLMQQGRLREAEGRFRQLIRLRPENADHHINLGGLLWFMGRHREALDAYREAVQLKPDYAVARYNLGITLLALGQFGDAAAQFAEAVRLQPGYAEALTGWGRALKGLGQLDEALQRFQESLAVRPDGFTWQQVASVHRAQNRPQAAIAALAEALKLRPEWPPALTDLAWIYATHSDSAVRDPARALELAEQAVRVTGGTQPEPLAALDAAYAQNGRFPDAIATAERGLKLALEAGKRDLASAAETRLSRYRAGAAYVE